MLPLNRPTHLLRPLVNNHPRLQMVPEHLQVITTLLALIPPTQKLLLPIGKLFQDISFLRLTGTGIPIRAAYGYDVNSTEFKDWAAGLQNQYAQYYAGQGQPGAGAGGASEYTPPAPGSAPPPPPPPSSDVPPPPPA